MAQAPSVAFAYLVIYLSIPGILLRGTTSVPKLVVSSLGAGCVSQCGHQPKNWVMKDEFLLEGRIQEGGTVQASS